MLDAIATADKSPMTDVASDLVDLPLEVFGLTKTWKKPQLELFKDLDLLLEPGATAWVGGRNGVGKTTLLRILAGLIGPDTGMVRAYGLDPARNRREFQRRVAFLSAGNAGLYARLTVRAQIDMWARMAFVPREARAAAVARNLNDFALEELAERRSDRLSMGQRQRLRIAMTFVNDPDVVLLDEPRSSLDGEGGDLLAAAIGRTAARGGVVLWVSPTGEDLNFPFSERYILEGGKLNRVDAQ
jgi:ABC-2 type transport system ATP-binding protein